MDSPPFLVIANRVAVWRSIGRRPLLRPGCLWVEVPPAWIDGLDKGALAAARAGLDLLFPQDGAFHRRVLLIPDQKPATVATSEAGMHSLLVFIDRIAIDLNPLRGSDQWRESGLHQRDRANSRFLSGSHSEPDKKRFALNAAQKVGGDTGVEGACRSACHDVDSG